MTYSVMMVIANLFAGAATGLFAAASRRAGSGMLAICVFGGSAFGLAFGLLSGWIADKALMSKTTSTGRSLLVYMGVPLLSLLLVIVGGGWLLRHIL